MPTVKPQGLQGLGSLSKAQYDSFINKNKDLISQHGFDPVYINNLYSNKQFIDKYGVDKFKAIPDIDMRNALYKEDIVNTEFDKLYNPKYNKNGFSQSDYAKYSQLSTDGKLKLMESGYLTPAEMNKNWKKHLDEINTRSKVQTNGGAGAFMPLGVAMQAPVAASSTGDKTADVLRVVGSEESAKRHLFDKNQKILDKIYGEDSDTAAKRYDNQISKAYVGWTDLSDDQIVKAFVKAITPDSYKDKYGRPNLGIPEYASHFGNGSKGQVTSEMKNFSIDEMRQILAKKQVYDVNMSPDMARTALNNEAMRYIKEHQGKAKRFGLFMKDVGISSMSYAADKLNGIAEIYRAGQDALAEKPVVMVDDMGEVLDPNKVKIIKDRQGGLHYVDKNGQMHAVHHTKVDYTTLHNMGKNPDGSGITGAFGIDWMTLNPKYWTRAEQFGTLDENEQKQYEKLGSSPYKVAYAPNEDGDLWYEAFKMMSFGVTDMLSQLIPFGIGVAGRSLSTASKAGKVINGFGKVLDKTGKMLTAETKAGQVVQGTSGALGIAYAYNRGAFQETLAQNLANAEEAVANAAQKDIYEQYNNDKKYKAGVDKLINARTASMKASYIAQMQKGDGMKIADEAALEKMLHAKAQDEVLGELVQKRMTERKASKEYADLQQKAIDGAGDASFNTFLTEGLKYGLVNNLGYRKYMYQNPTGVMNKVSTSLKGLKEITTKEGAKRLGTEASKFLTKKDKWLKFGRTVGSQAWGGAWTNGTDDMQVDAAERINEDSFNRYLDAYQNGEALADTYGFADGIYSYLKGLGNSLGQDTTWDAAAVGAMGSIVNFTPNFLNIARLGTREGRESYKNNFWRKVERNEDGIPLKNEDSSIKYKELGKWHDWRGQFSYFIQNGVLNTYYGMKQSERDLRSHADYVNNLLDSYKDFADIEHLVASNIASENIANFGDEKTLDYLRALQAVSTLNGLGNNSSDPAIMSSVVQNVKKLIEQASKINLEEGKSPFSEGEINNLLSQYYAQHPELPQNQYNDQKALYNIAQNAIKLREATDAYNKAAAEVQKIEKNRGQEIDPLVKSKMIMHQALDSHWIERKEKMQSEIDDPSSEGQTLEADALIATVGGRENAKILIKTYSRQQSELGDELTAQIKKSEALKDEYQEAIKELKEAKQKGYLDDINAAEKKRNQAKAKYESSKEQENYIEEQISKTDEKKNSLQASMNEAKAEEHSTRLNTAQGELIRFKKAVEDLKAERKTLLKKNGEPKKKYIDKVAEIDKAIADNEKNIASREETIRSNKERILTADEIFSLDPVTRAKMMREYETIDPETGEIVSETIYSKEQQREIDKLKRRLLMRDADALQKIQDIALLTQRIASNRDAYSRMSKNPEAAASELERQRDEAAKNAYQIIKQRSAQSLADGINKWTEDMKPHQDVTTEAKEQIVFGLLSKYKSDILKVIDEDNMLPQYQKQLQDAQDRVKAIEDMMAIIINSDRSDEWKENIFRNIQNVAEGVNTREELLSALEKIVDDTDGKESAKDFDYILKSMESLGYQRDATVLESRKQRQQREEEERKKKEEIKRKLDAEVKEAAQKQQDEIPSTGEGITMNNEEEVSLDDEKQETQKESKASASDQPAESTKEQQVTNINQLLQDDITEGSINEGEMWYGTAEHPSKGNFIVTKDNDKITFDIDGKSETLELDSESYNLLPDVEYPENAATVSSFKVTSMEKKGDGWVLNGTFSGSKNFTQVKADKSLDLAKAIESQKTNRELEIAAKGVDTANKSLIIEDDIVMGKSETIEEQYKESTSEGKEVQMSEGNTDTNNLNGVGQFSIDHDNTSLSGRAMGEYEQEPLEKDGVIERKKGTSPNDSMNKYFDWMKAAGIKLQNIIDQELGEIIRLNPHAKVKFMVVNPIDNATHDRDMKTHLMLVLEYDNSINKGITDTHNESNGGIIESKGKKYLIIGTVGYGKNNVEKLALYDILWGNNPKAKTGYGLIRRKYAKFFKENPTERFYVNEELSTEIMPSYPIPGYLVRQMEADSNPEFRRITELLKDESRNPKHLTLEKMKWGIQEATQYAVVGTTVDRVMVPRNTIENLGSAFALIPASNGKLVPAYLKVLKYTEMQDGELKKEIADLLQKVMSYDYQTRKNAIIELSKIFYFNKDGDTILTRKGRGEISLVHDGKVQNTFILDSNFDRSAFFKALEALNPRVNVTTRVLNNPELLKKYDEAGALMTDIALLHTAGSSYSIYALDGEGKIIKPEQSSNEVFKGIINKDFKNGDRKQVIYKHQYYREANGVFTLDGKTITDESLIAQLKYNMQIIDNSLSPALSKDVWDYYILSEENPSKVVKVNRNTKEVKEATEEQAKAIIEKVNEKKAKELREEKASKAIEEAKKKGLENAIDVDLGEDALLVDPETGELIQKEEKKIQKPQKEKPTEEKKFAPVGGLSKTDKPTEIKGKEHKASSQTFATLYKNPKYMFKILNIVKSKWKLSSIEITDIEKLLREKMIEVDNIGTSDDDINTWLDTLEKCRD